MCKLKPKSVKISVEINLDTVFSKMERLQSIDNEIILKITTKDDFFLLRFELSTGLYLINQYINFYLFPMIFPSNVNEVVFSMASHGLNSLGVSKGIGYFAKLTYQPFRMNHLTGHSIEIYIKLVGIIWSDQRSSFAEKRGIFVLQIKANKSTFFSSK